MAAWAQSARKVKKPRLDDNGRYICPVAACKAKGKTFDDPQAFANHCKGPTTQTITREATWYLFAIQRQQSLARLRCIPTRR
jgi:hypothetical protein